VYHLKCYCPKEDFSKESFVDKADWQEGNIGLLGSLTKGRETGVKIKMN